MNEAFDTKYGYDILARFSECSAKRDGTLVIDNAYELESLLVSVARKNRLVPVSSFSQKFTPQGASALVCIAEDSTQIIANVGLTSSHLTGHSWPEYRVLQVSLYTCDSSVNGVQVMFDIWDGVGAKNLNYRRIWRDEYFSIEKRRAYFIKNGKKVRIKRGV